MNFIRHIEKINDSIKNDIEVNVTNSLLKEAIYYCLSDGKRWRPILFLSLFETSNINIEEYSSLKSCYLFLEYVHNASLVLDDLPMMDNDDYRRNKLTLHKKFDEATSKLAGLQLILLGQYKINNMLLELKEGNYFDSDEQFHLFYKKLMEITFKYLGNDGLCLGQFIDLNMNEDKNKNLEKWLDMVSKKTSSLFILSFVLGFMFSRKTIENLDHIAKIGQYFGYIYQILDDLEDYEIDKIKNNNNNILSYISKEQADKLVKEYYKSMIDLMNNYNLGCNTIRDICKLLKNKWLKTKTI